MKPSLISSQKFNAVQRALKTSQAIELKPLLYSGEFMDIYLKDILSFQNIDFIIVPTTENRNYQVFDFLKASNWNEIGFFIDENEEYNIQQVCFERTN